MCFCSLSLFCSPSLSFAIFHTEEIKKKEFKQLNMPLLRKIMTSREMQTNSHAYTQAPRYINIRIQIYTFKGIMWALCLFTHLIFYSIRIEYDFVNWKLVEYECRTWSGKIVGRQKNTHLTWFWTAEGRENCMKTNNSSVIRVCMCIIYTYVWWWLFRHIRCFNQGIE